MVTQNKMMNEHDPSPLCDHSSRFKESLITNVCCKNIFLKKQSSIIVYCPAFLEFALHTLRPDTSGCSCYILSGNLCGFDKVQSPLSQLSPAEMFLRTELFARTLSPPVCLHVCDLTCERKQQNNSPRSPSVTGSGRAPL